MKGAIPQYSWVRIARDGLPTGHFCKVPPEHDKKNWCRIDITEVTEEELLAAADHIRYHGTTGNSRSEAFCVHCAQRGPTEVEYDEAIEEQTMAWYTGDMS